VVLPQAGRLDRHKPGEHLYVADWKVDSILPLADLESFVFAKTLKKIASENGSLGNAAVLTAGFRLTGKLPRRVDYVAMVARQGGNYASDRIAATAGDYLLGWRLNGSWRKPRVSVEFFHGSGDAHSGDGRRNSFDSLYASFHYYLGAADRLGLRNSRNLRTGLDLNLTRKLKGYFDMRELWLATARDGLYDAGGTRTLVNTKASSRRVGRELDCYVVYEVSRDFSLEGGLGYLHPGAYLEQSGRHAAYLYPYLIWTKKF
jgi:hypothetical protein